MVYVNPAPLFKLIRPVNHVRDSIVTLTAYQFNHIFSFITTTSILLLAILFSIYNVQIDIDAPSLNVSVDLSQIEHNQRIMYDTLKEINISIQDTASKTDTFHHNIQAIILSTELLISETIKQSIANQTDILIKLNTNLLIMMESSASRIVTVTNEQTSDIQQSITNQTDHITNNMSPGTGNTDLTDLLRELNANILESIQNSVDRLVLVTTNQTDYIIKNMGTTIDLGEITTLLQELHDETISTIESSTGLVTNSITNQTDIISTLNSTFHSLPLEILTQMKQYFLNFEHFFLDEEHSPLLKLIEFLFRNVYSKLVDIEEDLQKLIEVDTAIDCGIHSCSDIKGDGGSKIPKFIIDFITNHTLEAIEEIAEDLLSVQTKCLVPEGYITLLSSDYEEEEEPPTTLNGVYILRTFYPFYMSCLQSSCSTVLPGVGVDEYFALIVSYLFTLSLPYFRLDVHPYFLPLVNLGYTMGVQIPVDEPIQSHLYGATVSFTELHFAPESIFYKTYKTGEGYVYHYLKGDKDEGVTNRLMLLPITCTYDCYKDVEYPTGACSTGEDLGAHYISYCIAIVHRMLGLSHTHTDELNTGPTYSIDYETSKLPRVSVDFTITPDPNKVRRFFTVVRDSHQTPTNFTFKNYRTPIGQLFKGDICYE